MRGVARLRARAARAGFAAWLLGAAGCSSAPGYDVAAHVPYPAIPNGGGPTLSSATLVTVAYAGDPDAATLASTADWLAQSGWPAQVAGEYGVTAVHHLAHVLLSDAPPATADDTGVAALLGAKIADGTLPGAAAGAAPYVYVLLLPAGVLATRASGAACGPNPGNGYHDTFAIGGSEIPMVVMPGACDARFTAILSPAQSMELDLARLVVDALTDVSPRNAPAYALRDQSNPWATLGVEVGDFCWGRLTQAAPGVTLQRVWSNAAAAAGRDPCVPAVPGSVAFGASVTPSGLATLTVGVASTFRVTGWSLAPLPAWALQVTPWIGEYAIAASLDRDTLENGETATLTVEVPYAVPAGSYGAVRVQSATATDAVSWPVAFLVDPAP